MNLNTTLYIVILLVILLLLYKKKYCSFNTTNINTINQGLALLNNHFKGTGFIVAAMGNRETILGDVANSDLSAEKKKQFKYEHLKSVRLDTYASLTSGLKSVVKKINTIIGQFCLWINRPDNGRNNTSLGFHELVLITPKQANILQEAGYGIRYNGIDLAFYVIPTDYQSV